VLAFIDGLNTRALNYHNHKEASAWGGLAFFYLMMFAWIVPLGLREPLFNNWGLRLVGLVLVAGVTWLVKWYIDEQFKLRSIFGDYTAACYRLGARCIDMTEREINNLDFSVRALTTAAVGGHRDLALPRFINDEMAAFGAVPHPERIKLEKTQRVLLFGSAVVVAAAILFGRSFADAPSAALEPLTKQIEGLGSETNRIGQLLDVARGDLSQIGALRTDIANLQSRVAVLEQRLSGSQNRQSPSKSVASNRHHRRRR
jgi:hypothetical protein